MALAFIGDCHAIATIDSCGIPLGTFLADVAYKWRL